MKEQSINTYTVQFPLRGLLSVATFSVPPILQTSKIIVKPILRLPLAASSRMYYPCFRIIKALHVCFNYSCTVLRGALPAPKTVGLHRQNSYSLLFFVLYFLCFSKKQLLLERRSMSYVSPPF